MCCYNYYNGSHETADCKTGLSFALSPKIWFFERLLARCRETGERGQGGVMWPEEKENGDARFLPRPVLPFHDRVPKSPIFGLLAKEGTVLQFRNMKILTFSFRNTLINCYKHYLSLFLPLHNYTE